jgi:hypothetical protein
VSSGGATRQVDQMSDAEAFAYFAQLRAGGRKETAQQPIAVEPLHSVAPVLSVTSQPLEDPGQIRRDRRLSPAKGNQISRKAAKAQKNARKNTSNLFHLVQVVCLRPSVWFFFPFATLRLCVRSPHYPSPRNHRCLSQRFPRVPRAGSRSTP